jgi:hypothetical protein
MFLNNRKEDSSTPRLKNVACIDLEAAESSALKAIIFGGQSADTGLTLDEIIMIQGTIIEDINKAEIVVTRYPSSEYRIPEGWPDLQHLVQVGEIPESRTGSKLSFLKKIEIFDLLVSIVGHSKQDFSTDFSHFEESLNFLLVPDEMVEASS